MTISRTQVNLYQQLTSARVVATSNLTASYYNGPSQNGVKATLTADSAAALTIDGVTLVNGNRVLVQGQSSTLQNGVYIVKDAGSASTLWVLERSNDFQTIEQMKAGQYLTIDAGSTRRGALYVLTEPLPGAVGVDEITFTESTTGVALGTAATKDATNNALPDVASIAAGPSVQNHFATFADVNRTLEDAGFTMSDPNESIIASVIQPTVVGNFAKFSDVDGTIEDGGAAPSDPAEPLVASIDGATVIDHLAAFDDINGTIKDSGLLAPDIQLRTNIFAAKTTNIGGVGAGPITVAHPGITANSIVVATVESSANTVAVAKADPNTNEFDVTFTADPGASCILNYVVFVEAQ